MLIVPAFALALTTAAQVVQVPVESPRLPEGPLAYAGPFGVNRLYVDAASWERSNLPEVVGGTVVIVTPGDAAPPLQVMRAWIDCRRQVFQLSAGRAYNVAGVEFALTTFLADQPLGAEGPMKRLADEVCAPPFDLQTLASVPAWRIALDETRAAAAEGTAP